jgi:Protein of unknown function (DUF2865)
VAGEMVPRHDWLNGLDDTFWSGLRGRSAQPTQPAESERPRQRPPSRPEHAVRTLCVRLCDGYYWPISFATTRSRLSTDAKRCESSCTSPARLFHHRNPGQDVDDMRDRDGNPYRELPAAFLYRTRYLADCTCRPQPWEEEAAVRHRAFAAAAAAKASAHDKLRGPHESARAAPRGGDAGSQSTTSRGGSTASSGTGR